MLRVGCWVRVIGSIASVARIAGMLLLENLLFHRPGNNLPLTLPC